LAVNILLIMNDLPKGCKTTPTEPQGQQQSEVRSQRSEVWPGVRSQLDLTPDSRLLRNYLFKTWWQVRQRFWWMRTCLWHLGQRQNRLRLTFFFRGRKDMMKTPSQS